jgi:hypothetical protein
MRRLEAEQAGGALEMRRVGPAAEAGRPGTAGAVPAGVASQATHPGGFGTPPCRYYGRCARSSLMARFHLGTHKRGPETGHGRKAVL